MNTKLIEQSTKEEVIRGYSEDNKGFKCLLCGKYFTKGEIYDFNGKLYEAEKMVQLHIQESHESVLSSLLKLSSNDVGISDLQLGLLSLFAGGLSDKQISENLGVASSTIRNHRYKLREKERQAKVFLVIMELLEQKQGRVSKGTKSRIVKTEQTPTNSYTKLNNKTSIAENEVAAAVNKTEEVIMVRPNTAKASEIKDITQELNISIENYNRTDNINSKADGKNKTNIKEYETQSINNYIIEDTYNNSRQNDYLYVEGIGIDVSDEDKKTVLAMHLTEYGRLKSYPTTLKAQKIILEYVIESFIKEKKYVDSEVDIILMSIYVDYKILKRELIEQGFLSRSDKGGIYWVKGA